MFHVFRIFSKCAIFVFYLKRHNQATIGKLKKKGTQLIDDDDCNVTMQMMVTMMLHNDCDNSQVDNVVDHQLIMILNNDQMMIVM